MPQNGKMIINNLNYKSKNLNIDSKMVLLNMHLKQLRQSNKVLSLLKPSTH